MQHRARHSVSRRVRAIRRESGCGKSTTCSRGQALQARSGQAIALPLPNSIYHAHVGRWKRKRPSLIADSGQSPSANWAQNTWNPFAISTHANPRPVRRDVGRASSVLCAVLSAACWYMTDMIEYSCKTTVQYMRMHGCTAVRRRLPLTAPPAALSNKNMTVMRHCGVAYRTSRNLREGGSGK